MHRVLAAIASACLASTCLAECRVEITGPVSVQPGRFLKLSVAGDATDLQWVTAGLAEDEWLAFEDSKGARFLVTTLPSPGRYQFTAIGCRVVPGSNPPAAELGIDTIVVECKGDRPEPPPGPNPPPGPPQPPPPGPVDPDSLAEFVAKKVAMLSPDDRSVSPAVAKAFRDGATDIREGRISSVAELNTKTKARNAAAVGTKREAWVPIIRAIGDELVNRKLSTLDEHAAAWDSIAKGVSP